MLGAYVLDFKGGSTASDKLAVNNAFSQLPLMLLNRSLLIDRARLLLPRCADCCGHSTINSMDETLQKFIVAIDTVFVNTLPGGKKITLRAAKGLPCLRYKIAL